MVKATVAVLVIFLHVTLVTAGLATYEHGMLTELPPTPLKLEVVVEIVTSGLSVEKIKNHVQLNVKCYTCCVK
jgi:hypothetical protein